MICANHAHVFPKQVRQDGTLDRLKAIMDECGIEKAVAFATFHDQVKGAIEPVSWLHEEIRNDSRFWGFGVVDFSREDIEDQVGRISDLGFKGIKLHPAFQKFRVDGEKACRVYARAEELGLFLCFHTGIHWHRIADYAMLLFDEVAFRFPKLRFSMEHVGGYCFFKEAVAVMLNNSRGSNSPRVFAGLTSVFDRGANRPWFLSDEQISDLIWLTGEDTSIFGLDFPYNQRDEIAAAIEHINALPIADSAKQKILGGNLLRVLGEA